MQEIVQAIGQVSLFGQCDIRDLQSVESERREKDKRIQLEREKRWKENRLAEDERKRIEDEDYIFALKEQEKLDALYLSPSKTSGRGRGATITRLLESSPPPNFPKGRGRFARISKNKNSSFHRDILLGNQIAQSTGGEQIHRNSHQEQYWQGGNTVNYTLHDSNLKAEDDAVNASDFNDNLPTWVNNEDSPSNYSDIGACAPDQFDHHSSYPDLTVNCDQFEDAGSSSSTYMSVKMSPFGSASSSVTPSPVQPRPLPTGQLTRRPPRSRIAAKFSNPITTSTEDSNVNVNDLSRINYFFFDKEKCELIYQIKANE